ncbi:MAG: omptin family outer membrane protease [Treponema sp.]|nr:omptin family outer membrane protease [Candidatus Treponema merdequi]
MKKNLIAILIAFASINLFAESQNTAKENFNAADNKKISLSVEPLFGIRIGNFGEQVYAKHSSTGEVYKISELIYNFSPALYSGFETDLRIVNFHFSAGCKFFIPMQIGIMSDSDWCQDAGYNTGNTGIKTNLSEHENHLRNGFNLDLTVKYDFHPLSWLTISPNISFLLEKFTLSELNGTCWYGNPRSSSSYSYYSYDDIYNRTVSNCTGEIVQLRRTDYYVWAGVDGLFSFNKSRLDIFCGLYIAPYIYTYGEDDHYKRPRYFIDVTASLFYAGKIKTYIKYNFSKSAAIKLSGTFLFTGNMKGNELSSSTPNGKFVNSGGVIGASSMYTDIQLSGIFVF